MARRKSVFLILGAIIFIILFPSFCDGERKHMFLYDLCEESKTPEIRLSVWEEKGESAVTLSLSRDEYPSGLNCCVTVTTDKRLAVEINDINLPQHLSPNSCLDHLEIDSETDSLSLCHQNQPGHGSENEAMNIIESVHFIKICFNSSHFLALSEEQSTQYGFTLTLIAFSREKNPELCSKLFDGFPCRNSTVCLPYSLKCDGQEDCIDGFDENENNCKDVTTIAEVETPAIGISLQGAITLGGIAVIVCAVLVMCMWQCLLKFKPGIPRATHSSDAHNEINNLPMTIYTVPIAGSSSSNFEVPSSSTADRIIVACATRQTRIGDLPPSYDTLFGNNNNCDNNNRTKTN